MSTAAAALGYLECAAKRGQTCDFEKVSEVVVNLTEQKEGLDEFRFFFKKCSHLNLLIRSDGLECVQIFLSNKFFFLKSPAVCQQKIRRKI